MPKLMRVSGEETIRKLENLGFKKSRQRGSHVVLKKQTPDSDMVVLFHCTRNWQLAPCTAF